MKPLTIDIRDDIKATLRVKVRMPRAFGLRNWLAVKFIQLAGLVSAVPIEIEFEDRRDG